MTLTVGMKVKLKSGGPTMTVISPPTSHSRRVYCEWTEGGQDRTAAFDGSYLVEVGE